MLALLLVLLAVAPEPIRVEVGAIVYADVDISPSRLIYDGPLRAEDPSVAAVSGSIRHGGSYGLATVEGVAPGQTRMILIVFSGLSIYRIPVANIIVEERCDAPSVTLAARHILVAERQPLTLAAMTSGSAPVSVEWYDGEALLGVANPLTVSMSRGVHRITARAANRCGVAVSEDLDVTVVPLHRRSAAVAAGGGFSIRRATYGSSPRASKRLRPRSGRNGGPAS